MMARRDFVRTGVGGLTMVGARPLLGGCTSAAIGAHDKVRPGDELHSKSEILEAQPSKSRPDQGRIKVHTTTFNQNGEVVQDQVGNLLVLRKQT